MLARASLTRWWCHYDWTKNRGQVKEIGRAESNQDGLILGADVFLGFCILLAPYANDRSENADTALSLLDLTAKLVPCVESSNAGWVWLLPCNLKDVAKSVIVKTSHRCQVGGESV